MPNTKRLERSEEILNTISRLFAEKGYTETTMRGIAKELNLKAASLYNYFDSKEEALFKVLNNSMNLGLEKVQKICNIRISPKDKLYRVIESHIEPYSIKKEGPVLLMEYIDKLTEEHRQILIDKERRFANLVATIFQELEENGQMKNIPPKIAVFIFLGMVNYTVKWYHKDGPVGPEELRKYMTEIFAKGILK